MFKLLPDVEVKVERVPTWVWACLIFAVFFFGTLYLVPEARNALARLFAQQTPIAKEEPDPQSLLYPTEEAAERICGQGRVAPWSERATGRFGWVCI